MLRMHSTYRQTRGRFSLEAELRGPTMPLKSGHWGFTLHHFLTCTTFDLHHTTIGLLLCLLITTCTSSTRRLQCGTWPLFQLVMWNSKGTVFLLPAHEKAKNCDASWVPLLKTIKNTWVSNTVAPADMFHQLPWTHTVILSYSDVLLA